MTARDDTTLARIEEAGLNASAPPQQRLLDGWLLRLSPGKAKRARCINALSAGRLALPDKLSECQAAYDEAGLPLIVRITPFSEPFDLDARLEALGIPRFDDTRVLVRTDRAPPAARALPNDLRLSRVGHAAFARAVGTLRGSPLSQQQAHEERLVNSPVPYAGFQATREGVVVACGQYAREGERVGLYDVYTAASERGNGLATALCAHLLSVATAEGARCAYLQVDADNAPALAVYRRLGFVEGYRYHYRAREPGRV